MIIPGFVISIVTFPGVIVHELAHALFCKLTGTTVRKVCYFRLGNPAGYVIHDRPASVWKHILIGVGPFFLNTLLGLALGIVAALAHFDFEQPTAVSGVLMWLAISIAMHSFPSTGDARSIWDAVWSKGAPFTAMLVGVPLVAIIFLGAAGSVVWLDLAYGCGVVIGLPKVIVTGYFCPGEAGPTAVVTASYPGASASVIADTVAAPIEQQINGVERMERLESESRADGTYVAHVLFKPGADPNLVATLVRNRAALAKPILPEEAQRAGISVAVQAAEEHDVNRVVIAIVNRGQRDWYALRELSETVAERFSADGAITAIDLAIGPSLVYRVDMYPAMRITGLPPAGRTKVSAASRCVELADAVMKGQARPGDFAVMNLTKP
jgi:hypothetical protein